MSAWKNVFASLLQLNFFSPRSQNHFWRCMENIHVITQSFRIREGKEVATFSCLQQVLCMHNIKKKRRVQPLGRDICWLFFSAPKKFWRKVETLLLAGEKTETFWAGVDELVLRPTICMEMCHNFFSGHCTEKEKFRGRKNSSTDEEEQSKCSRLFASWMVLRQLRRD